MIQELRYGNTNTYLISCNDGYLMFDTDWAGTFQRMCQALGEIKVKLSEVKYLLISHFHPDHMGLAGELMEQGVRVLVLESQLSHIHDADSVFEKDKRTIYKPMQDDEIQPLSFEKSREFLQSIGIEGFILSTPGHSDDSISLLLDSGDVFVGDLYPLYEVEVHEEVDVQESWNRILECKPKRIFYGHAKTAILKDCLSENKEIDSVSITPELNRLVKKIMRYVDKGMHVDKISAKLKLDKMFVEDVCRMYLTHPNVSVQGILDRIEIKDK